MMVRTKRDDKIITGLEACPPHWPTWPIISYQVVGLARSAATNAAREQGNHPEMGHVFQPPRLHALGLNTFWDQH